jgi:hypothetical protein
MTSRILVACALAATACRNADTSRQAAAQLETAATRDARPAPLPVDSARSDTRVTGARIALDGDGLMLIDAVTGSTRALSFGTPATSALAAATAVLGAPRSRDTNHDCGAGALDFVSFEEGLLLNVQDERFVGWTVRPGSGRTFQTMAGISLGSSRAELESAYTATVQRTTLGTEFSAGGLHGVLASSAASAPITDLWAGTNCIAR